MNGISEILAILFGFLLRMGLPMAATVLLILVLQRLDTRWQAEGEHRLALEKLQPGDYLTKVHCWDIRECSPEARGQCAAYRQPDVPCWETHRVDGKLQESCRTCALRKRVAAVSVINL